MGDCRPKKVAMQRLSKEVNELEKGPVEGVRVSVTDLANMFRWDVTIFGPPLTIYEGGFFKVRLFLFLILLSRPFSISLMSIHIYPLQ